MNKTEFDIFAAFLKKEAGIVINIDRTYLVENRLRPIAKANGFEDISQLIHACVQPINRKLGTVVVEAMTTNESSFFRDNTPFQNLRNIIIPKLMENKSRSVSRRIRIWCAAASTGQEPYSIIMTLLEMGKLVEGWRFEILGTDINATVLEKARSGMYTQFEVQRGTPMTMLVKYFEQNGDVWQIKPQLRSMVTYKTFNLLDSFASLGRFDLIFCRNVLIYFDSQTKTSILQKMSNILSPDGFLMLGSAETVLNISTCFETNSGIPGVYQLKQQASTSATGTHGFSSLSR